MNIVFYIGPSWKPWNPESIRLHGEGGSEIAASTMARLLVERGHTVSVYNDPGVEGDYDGVQYLHHHKFHHLTGDVLIASRTPGAVDAGYENTFGKSILWHHDMHEYNSLNPERNAKFDLHLALSDYHLNYLKNYYPFIDKIKKTSNGLNLELYQRDDIVRHPHKAIYSSSPNRGLHVACQMWPKIRKQIPDAELHIFYGFDNWQKTVEKKQDQLELMEMRLIKGLAESTAGVILRGRVGPAQLAEEQLSSSLWFYPTAWHETSCITAMEAQAAGMKTVTTNLAALTETVGNAGVLINGNHQTLSYQDEFIAAAVNLMQSPLRPAKSNQFDWNKVCDQWEKDFL